MTIEPGMRVCAGENRGPYYIVRAVDGDEAWLRPEHGSKGHFAPLHRLRLVP